MEFRIVKNGTNNFTHFFDNKDVNLSDFEVVLQNGTFTIQCLNGANIPVYGVNVTDIILNAGSGDETFSNTEDLRIRLEAVGYTAYLGQGMQDNIETYFNTITLGSDNFYTLPSNVNIFSVYRYEGVIPETVLVRPDDWNQSGNIITFYEGLEGDVFYIVGFHNVSATPIDNPYIQDVLAGFGIEIDKTNPFLPVIKNAFTDSLFMGSAKPTDTPSGTGDAFWLATQSGTYTNFGGVIVNINSLAVISRNSSNVYSISQTDFITPPESETVGIEESEWAGLADAAGNDAIHFPTPFEFDGIVTQIKVPIVQLGTFFITVADVYTAPTFTQPNKIYITATELGNITFDVNIPISAGQFIGLGNSTGSSLKYKFITGGYVFAFRATKFVKAIALNQILEIKVDDNYNEQQAEIELKLDKNRLSPCVLYFDNFATDKNIKKFNLVSGSYVMQDTPAYTNIGWTKSVENTTMFYIRPTTAGNSNNSLTLNHNYTCEFRKHRYMIKLENLNSIIRIKTHNYPVSEGDSLFEFDFPVNKMRFLRFDGDTAYEQTISFTPVVGKLYWIELFKHDYTATISIYDTNDLTNKTIYTFGNDGQFSDGKVVLMGQFEIYLHSGNPFKLYENSVTTEGLGSDVYATGDSIMNGFGLAKADRWVTKVKTKVRNMVISSRGTSNFDDVLARLTSEVEFLRPKILFSANGYNGTVTQAYIDALSNFCKDRNIQYIQTMITGLTPATRPENLLYAQQNRQTVRFDIACCINGDLSLGMDTSDYPDNIHPNVNGSLKLANRVFVDIPQLVESFNKQ